MQQVPQDSQVPKDGDKPDGNASSAPASPVDSSIPKDAVVDEDTATIPDTVQTEDAGSSPDSARHEVTGTLNNLTPPGSKGGCSQEWRSFQARIV